jgi:hypothetical protein
LTQKKNASTGTLFQELLSSEAAPYAVLSIILYLMPAVSMPLLPLLVRSLFALVTAARAIPAIVKHRVWRQYGQKPSDQLMAVQSSAMLLSTNLEIAALPWLLVSIFTTGIFLPILYAFFIRWQYAVNMRTRLAIGALDDFITKASAHPQCPPNVRTAYQQFRTQLARFSLPIPADN